MGFADNLGFGDAGGGEAASLRAKRENVDQYKAATAPKPQTGISPARLTAPSNIINPKARYGDKKGEKRIGEAANWAKPLGSFKKGGKVKKTGVYMLHKKEAVMPAKMASGMAKVLGGKK